MKDTLFCRIVRFYVDGFRSMTWGRALWAIILLKLFVMFCVLKVFFFPDVLARRAGPEGEGAYVASELVGRMPVSERHGMPTLARPFGEMDGRKTR
ncbi:MAG: DUF4492 domain-containing protein [Bacteroidaceae bacterium]